MKISARSDVFVKLYFDVAYHFCVSPFKLSVSSKRLGNQSMATPSGIPFLFLIHAFLGCNSFKIVISRVYVYNFSNLSDCLRSNAPTVLVSYDW